jgi:hypothetical protein
MTYVVTSEFELNRVVAPRLPAATQQYDERYINQLNNVLRLYFNQLDNILGQLSTSGGISGVQFPGRFPHLTTHYGATLPRR